MAYSSFATRVLFVTALLTGLACQTKTVPGAGARPATDRNDAGGGQAPAPDDPTKCMVFANDEKRQPGQACTCASDCTTGSCDNGVCCDGKACGAKRPQGAACVEGTQCSSGFCADGLCCNVACTGACLSCNQPDMLGECAPVGAGVPDPHMLCRKDSPETCGQSGVCNGQGGCAKYSPDTVCKLGVCDGEFNFIPPSTCDGEGTCQAATSISCSPSRCMGTQCIRTCTSNDACVAGKACLNGSCGKFGPGQSCDQNAQCESNFCVDGVCCDSACTEICKTCSSPTARGKCMPAAKGATDPMCPTTPASSCGTDGKCDGAGECSKYDPTTTCRAPKCDPTSNTATMAAKCDDGVCPIDVESHSCDPFQGCAGNSCVGTCGSDRQCSGGLFCTAGSCGKRPQGGKCNGPDDCTNGLCYQGFCCNAVCDGVCKTCALAGKQGTCSNVPKGGVDVDGRCPVGGCTNGCNAGACVKSANHSVCGDMAICVSDSARNFSECDANGNCLPRNNQMCAAATPVCKDGACVKPNKPNGEACLNGGECASGQCVAGTGGGICCNMACAKCNQCNLNGIGCTPKTGDTCPTNEACKDGACAPNCAVGTMPCTVAGGTVCIGDFPTNPSHCGACNVKCNTTTETCKNGACECTGTKTACMVGAKKVCVETDSDKAHCGGCNKPCGTKCTKGVCAPATCPNCMGDCKECNTINGVCGNKVKTTPCSVGQCDGLGVCKPLPCPNCLGDCKVCDGKTGICGNKADTVMCATGKCDGAGTCKPIPCPNCDGECQLCDGKTGICGSKPKTTICSVGKCDGAGMCKGLPCVNCGGECQQCDGKTGICGSKSNTATCSIGKCDGAGMCKAIPCTNCGGECQQCDGKTGVCGGKPNTTLCSIGKCDGAGMCKGIPCTNCDGECQQCDGKTGICGSKSNTTTCSIGKCDGAGTCKGIACSNCDGECQQCDTKTGTCGSKSNTTTCSTGKCDGSGSCKPIQCSNCDGDCHVCDGKTGTCGMKDNDTPCGIGGKCQGGICELPLPPP